ncbi:MAG TPA: adenylosuccinate lyase family protein [Jatrophihabitantaceae bacterium]|jgi:adenylosuccinate lyase
MTGPSHLRDSLSFGHLWATDAMRAWFGESERTRAWLLIYAGIAAAQADIGAIPRTAAEHIAACCATARPSLASVSARTREAGHSTAGLVEWLRDAAGPEGARYVAVATTVQDVSDTWTALTLQRTGQLIERDLVAVVGRLRILATRYRDTPMMARTHGQPAVPITFGFKLAQWGAEFDRHLQRLRAGRARWESAQLGGSVGSLAYWGPDAPRLLEAFSRRIGLPAPVLPWGSARDCVAEFATCAGLVSATLAKVGNEIYQLQRPEIGELSEPVTSAQIGSVTMPHKRNPERCEHLVTLNTLVRSHVGALLAGMVSEHERDGRAWKVEWIALPDLCCEITRASSLARELLDGLDVHTERMQHNIDEQHQHAFSEQLVRSLAGRLGYSDAYASARATTGAARSGQLTALESSGAAAEGDESMGIDAAIASAVALTDRWLSGSTP